MITRLPVCPAAPAAALTGIQNSISRLDETLRELSANSTFALAYSGGLDSRFLAHAATRAGLQPHLIHVTGPHVAPDDSAYARQWAVARGFPYQEIRINPLNLEVVANGDKRRCYGCKHLLFSHMKEIAQDLPLCDGTHASDLQGYRPGLAALTELGISSPLADAGLSKIQIRELALLTCLEQPAQRARPCLLTRLPYGEKPTETTLAMLAHVEQAVLAELYSILSIANSSFDPGSCPGQINDLLPDLERGMPDFRVRLTAPARLELHIRPMHFPTPLGFAPESVQAQLLHRIRAELGVRQADFQITVVEMENLSGYFDHQKK